MVLWTLSHARVIIPELLGFLAISFLLGYLLRNRSDVIKRIPLQLIAVMLLVMEIGKQYFSVVDGVYNLYSLPLHYCSLFLFVLPVHAFYTGKWRDAVSALAFALSASLLIFMLIMPDVVYSDANYPKYLSEYLSFHTVTFHALVCFYFMLMFSFGLSAHKPKRDTAVISVFLAVYETVAFIFAQTLKTNFNNLYECTPAFLENARIYVMESFGALGYVIFLLGHVAVVVAFTLISYFLLGAFYKIRMKKIK